MLDGLQITETLAPQPEPQIRLMKSENSTHFLSSNDYVDYYAQTGRHVDYFSKRKQEIDAVAQKITTDENAVFHFDLYAGDGEQSRSFPAMYHNLAGYSSVLANACYEQGYNLHVVVAIDKKQEEYGRLGILEQTEKGKVYGKLPDDPTKPTKTLYLTKDPGKHIPEIYQAGGALIGYYLQASMSPPQK